MQEMLFVQVGRKPHYNVERKSLNVLLEVAQMLGAMLGEKIYFGFKTQILSKNWLQKMLKINPSSEGFLNLYLETVSIVNSLPDPIKSKNEKL
jgi:hypothetical protein